MNMRLHAQRTGPILTALLILMLGSSAAVSQGTTTRIPQSKEEIRLSYAPLVKRVAPAVVNIYTRKLVSQVTSPLLQDPFFRRFLRDRNQQLPGSPGGRNPDQTHKPNQGQQGNRPRTRKKRSSLGSGVIVGPEGHIITNHHVIKNADEITVVLSDRRQFPAKVVLKDKRTDLAVLKIETKEKLPFLDFADSDALEVGDLVLAIGNPFGVGQTVTSGIVSALARTRVGVTDFRSFIQTDAAINPGNSGGALVTMDGRLVGVNTAIYSRSGGSVGIGFAIPSNMVKFVLSGAKGGKIVRPWLGVAGQSVSADIASSIGLDRPGGMIVSDVYPGGPAEKAGLKTGDVVLRLNGKDILDGQELRFRLATLQVGGTAELDIMRDGKPMSLTVGLKAPPRKPAPNKTPIIGRNPLSGAVVANLSPALAEELGVFGSERGVVLTKVEPGSIAQRFRLKENDIVLKINGERVRNVKHLIPMLQTRPSRWEVIMERRGKKFRIAARG